ncbi:ABC transporter permease subunit [Marinomonas fungiae]|uniref:ABC-type spermidine/putrescine transport system, permease component I n=1 Tax=Marinomonas fungiae TaxID=1137284 RepID=A0A0K6IQ28_9GAMM|nr:ABC transporter permease subunit [Marinomonas fungiae]CUB05201.1 ABC-type spermidine/putrescine transport system, permease component I [Marinomonas fungiae]
MNKLIERLKLSTEHGKKWVIAVPTLWLVLFFALPFLIVLKIAFAEAEIAIPPYTALLSMADQAFDLHVYFGNFIFLTEDDLYLTAYLNSLEMAAISTFFCLLIGYPMAYFIARAKPSTQSILLLLILLPSWTSFLIRIYAWIGILKSNGVLNNVLMWTGVINEPLAILNTNIAVYIGIVYAYLPFMVLPLYSNLVKHDYSLIEASQDLGARRLQSFWHITFPLSRNGIVAGSMLVFIPVVGEYVIPELLGGTNSIVIGKVLWQEFFNNRDWPLASALALIMLLILMVPIHFFRKHQEKEWESDK